MLSEPDRRLLRHLQHEPDLAVAELAEKVGMPLATASRRIKKLADDGVLKGQHMVINWAALGYSVEVSLRVSLDKTQSSAFDEFLAEARLVKEVIELQTFLGRVDVRVSLIARDMAHYQEIYRDKILTLPHISEIEALMQVATIKSDEVLPV